MKVVLDMCIPSETHIFIIRRVRFFLTGLNSHGKCYVGKSQQNEKKKIFSNSLLLLSYYAKCLSILNMATS